MNELKCPKCGSKLPRDSDFCQYCGETISHTLSDNKQTQNDTIINLPPNSKNNDVENSLLKGFMLIEDKNWKKATECFDSILEKDIQCSDAYIGKLLIELHCYNRENLFNTSTNLLKNKNFIRACKFATENEKIQLKKIANQNKINVNKRNVKAKKTRKSIIIASVSLCLVIAIAVGGFFGYKKIIVPATEYKKAEKLLNEKQYDNAIAIYERLGSYKKSKSQKNECFYRKASSLLSNKNYKSAIEIFKSLAEYKDSRVIEKEARYTYAVDLYNNKKYADSADYFYDIKDYKDSNEYLQKSEIYWRTKGNTIKLGKYEQDGNISNGKESIEWIILDTHSEENSVLLISKYCLEFKQYHNASPYMDSEGNYDFTRNIGIAWVDCDLRRWLNSDFYAKVFSNIEKSKLIPINIIYSLDLMNDNSHWITDNVSILSTEEAQRLFNNQVQLSTSATVQAYLNRDDKYNLTGAQKHSKYIASWWLRSDKKKMIDAVESKSNIGNSSPTEDKGSIYKNAALCTGSTIAVRPIIRFSIK